MIPKERDGLLVPTMEESKSGNNNKMLLLMICWKFNFVKKVRRKFMIINVGKLDRSMSADRKLTAIFSGCELKLRKECQFSYSQKEFKNATFPYGMFSTLLF